MEGTHLKRSMARVAKQLCAELAAGMATGVDARHSRSLLFMHFKGVFAHASHGWFHIYLKCAFRQTAHVAAAF